MARTTTVIGSAEDIHGNRYDVRERRPTAHGFDVLLGWPVDRPRGPGGGGPKAILTGEVADYLDSIRLSPKDAALPVGRNTIKRLRAEMGLNWYVDNCCWWRDNPNGPGRSYSAVSLQRELRGLRSRLWTKEEDAALLRMVQEGKRVAEIATSLGKTKAAIWCRLRKLRRKQGA
ncbi:hypothetical protein LJC46_08620 [Desulfovibrio sp. OttesenSCG-928-G15]|nr:hypothetical protein [Desulfovibrio sp. OttesenSCG-928-G15]